MKRLAISLSIIALLAMFFPAFSILAQPTHTPHENPATARSSPVSAALLLAYSNVFDLTTMGQYQDAQSVLNELEQVNIPDELRDTIDSYNRLSSQLLTTLNNLEALLDETSTLFARDQTSDAKQKLNEAETTVRNALFLLEDAETVTETLGDELGVFAALAGSQIRLAYDRLEENLRRLRQHINELNQLRESLGLDPLMAISTSFYHSTFLEVSAPETAYPGLPITLSGQVSSTDGTIDRTIKVLLDNTQLAQEIIRGQFNLRITPPPQISTGKHRLTVVAIPQGRYAGASTSLTIDISRLPIQTDIQTPSLIVIPKTVQVSGRVYHNLSPIANASISVTFRDSTTTARTSADGRFTASLRVPLNLSLVGPQPLTITVAPVEPWYASPEIERWVFTINPSNIGLLLVAFLSLGLLLYNRIRTRLAAPREEKVLPPPPAQELPAVTPPARPKYRFTGIKGRILSAYLSGLGAVEKITGTPMVAPATLREFLETTAIQLPTAIKSFAELTTIAEVALYSAHRLDEAAAARAEQLATTIKEELYNETS